MRLEPIRASEWLLIPKEVRTLMRTQDVIYFGLNDVFFDSWNNDFSINFDYGGMGSGKSSYRAVQLIAKSLSDPYFRCYFGRKVFDTVGGSVFKTITDTIEDLGIQYLFNYSTKPNSSKNIECILTGNTFVPYGCDDPQKLKSIKDPTHIWMEEADQFSLADFSLLLSRLRTEKAKTQMYMTSNTEKVHDGHWLRKNLIDVNYKGLHTTISTYRDNYFLDQDAYFKKLELAYGHNQILLNAVVNGAWGILSVGNPFFYAYKPIGHYTNERYRLHPSEIIYLSFDFNANPNTLLVAMVHDKEIAIIDLILGDENIRPRLSPLEACCDQFNEKYVRSGLMQPAYIIVTGDASGTSKTADNVKNKNFYSKICEMLSISPSQIKKRKHNIEHILSREICNSLIYNTNFKIYKSAYLLTVDLITAYADDKGTLNEAKKDKTLSGFHIADAFRYFCDCILEFDKWKDWIRYYSSKAA